MKQPSTLYVGEVLRVTKNFFSPLNFINPKKWTPENYNEWRVILGLEPIIIIKPAVIKKKVIKEINLVKRNSYENNGKPRVKVLRISDNKEFKSITECKKSEGFCNTLMQKILNDGIKYKRM